MHQKYIELFKEVTHATEILAEQVMNFDHERKDDKGEATAQSMRDDYAKLYDRMRADDFDAALQKIVSKAFTEHQRIIFNGNG